MRNDSGQDLLEYALLVALIALVCVGVITSTGTGVKSIFTDISSELTKANPSEPTLGGAWRGRTMVRPLPSGHLSAQSGRDATCFSA